MKTLSDLKVSRVDSLKEGRRAAAERADQVDGTLRKLTDEAMEPSGSIALVAVGGYGRGLLSPHSDIDVLFVARKRKELEDRTKDLRGILYPLWDAGFQVGHATVTAKEAVARCASDVHAATSLLDARHVAGSVDVSTEIMDRRDRATASTRKRSVRSILRTLEERYSAVGDAGWSISPDIKQDRGGLRDAAAVGWFLHLLDDDHRPPQLLEAEDTLLAIREILHDLVGRRFDRLRLDLQPKVARRLGFEEADVPDLMAEVHRAARVIERTCNEAAARASTATASGPRRSGSFEQPIAGVHVIDGELHPAPGTAPSPTAALVLLEQRATRGLPVADTARAWLRSAFERAREEAWDPATRNAFVGILAAPHAERTLREMDHLDALESLIPGWSGVRGLRADDLYHRFTVDAHSFRCVGELGSVGGSDPLVRAALDEIGDPTNLLIAGLLHDIGKGRGGDHAESGAAIAERLGRHMGLDDTAAAEVTLLVRHHLLLADTATRRDLDDPSVILGVARLLCRPRVLQQLLVLTHADARATGPEAWTPWKATLVADLYRKAMSAMTRGDLPAGRELRQKLDELRAYDPVVAASAEGLLQALPPSYLNTDVAVMTDELRMLALYPAHGRVHSDIHPMPDGDATVTICTEDGPGILARSSGIFALHRIEVRRAQIFSSSDGRALQRFLVHPPAGVDWSRFARDLEDASSGRLALEARLIRKLRDYSSVLAQAPVDVRVLNEEAPRSTVLEVRTTDRLGLLYAVTSALASLDLDIHVAKIDTLADRVVDVFYVRDSSGNKLDASQAEAVQMAVEHRLDSIF